MEFWSHDEGEFFEERDDENTESLDEQHIRRFYKWLQKKKRLGVELTPEDLNKIEEVIDNCIENGYFKLALRFCNTLLQYNPTSADLLVKKGFVLINLRDYQNATNTLEEALTINPNNSNGLIFLSLIHFNEGNLEKSLNLLDKVLSFEPNNFALYNKAIVLQAYQQFDDALEIFQKLLDDENYKIEALQEISHILFLQGKYEESLNANLEALEIEPNNFWHWFNLGHCYLELHRFYKSVDAFQNA
ncbi:MAG: tetratricopeptide repeat protein, partial [Candidatus Kapaibacteriota bacterium]